MAVGAHRAVNAGEAVDPQRHLVESEAIDDVEPPALQHDVGIERGLTEPIPIIRIGQLGERSALAVAGVDHEGRNDRHVRTSHAEDIGTECCERAPGGRPGEHLRQIENAPAVEWSHLRWRPPLTGCVALALDDR